MFKQLVSALNAFLSCTINGQEFYAIEADMARARLALKDQGFAWDPDFCGYRYNGTLLGLVFERNGKWVLATA